MPVLMLYGMMAVIVFWSQFNIAGSILTPIPYFSSGMSSPFFLLTTAYIYASKCDTCGGIASRNGVVTLLVILISLIIEVIMSDSDVARAAFELYSKYIEIEKELNETKAKLRDIAGGHKKEIIVEGVGKINISAPSTGSTKTVTTLSEDVLAKIPGLREKLLEKGVIREDIKTTSPSAAKVTITLNV